jgi:polyphosphate kinase 2 (PPK2 family)
LSDTIGSIVVNARGVFVVMKKSDYEAELEFLQIELVRLQRWVKQNGERVVVVFEARDAAGKGGMIRTITAKISARVFRVVGLPSRDKSDAYDDHNFIDRHASVPQIY